jgi:hypothetical protein
MSWCVGGYIEWYYIWGNIIKDYWFGYSVIEWYVLVIFDFGLISPGIPPPTIQIYSFDEECKE